MSDLTTENIWVSPGDYDLPPGFSHGTQLIQPIQLPRKIVFASEKGHIEIDTFTGNVKIVGLSPDEAALEFWRGLERAYPAAFPNRNAR